MRRSPAASPSRARGTLVLTGANSHVGGTTVSAGTLLANNTSGSGTGVGDVLVNGTGTFGGTGAVTGAVSVGAGGTLAPGASIGTLATGALSLDALGSFSAEIDANLPAADLLQVTGGVSLGGATLALSLTQLQALAGGPMTFLVLQNDATDPILGTFGTISGLSGVMTATVHYSFSGTDALGRVGDGNDLAVTVAQAPAPVPEPMSLGLLCAGLLGVLRLTRRQRRSDR